MAIVDIEHVTKAYRAHPGTRVLLGRGGLATLLSRHYTPDTAIALNDISMSVELGECIGIAGASGSGKSTLLKLIAGVTTPTSGTVTVLGRATSVMDTEFEPRLSGRENVYLCSRLDGLTLKEAGVIVDAVRDFAEIGDAIEQPVASYSTGMRLRLAFAIAAHTSPDILLMDSDLGLADTAFQQKCAAAFEKLREQGKTIVLVVDPRVSAFENLCDRVVTLAQGEIVSEDSHESEPEPIEHAIEDEAPEEPVEMSEEQEPKAETQPESPSEPAPVESESDELTLERDTD